MKSVGILVLLILLGNHLFAQKTFEINVKNVGAEIQPDMYGVFFEDINFGADGGLYAELIKNRSFEFHQPFVGWTPFGNVDVQNENPCFDRNTNYVRLNETGLRRGTGLENNGFTGIGYQQNNTYNFSFFARSMDDNEKKFKIELVSAENNEIGNIELLVQGKTWKKYSCQIKATATSAKGKLRLILQTEGEVDLDHISLFPSETWKNRENGLRKDIVEVLYDLNPGVFPLPRWLYHRGQYP